MLSKRDKPENKAAPVDITVAKRQKLVGNGLSSEKEKRMIQVTRKFDGEKIENEARELRVGDEVMGNPLKGAEVDA